MSLQAVSKHLAVLERAGLVTSDATRSAGPSTSRRTCSPRHRLARALPAPGRGALPAPRRRARRAGGRRGLPADRRLARPPRNTDQKGRTDDRCLPLGTDRSRSDRAADPHHPRLRRHARAAVPGPHRPRAVRPLGRPERHHHPHRPLGRPHAAAAGRSPTCATARSTRSTAASTRSRRPASCRPSPSTAGPTGVSLETLTFTDLGDGRTRLVATSLVDSFEGRDQWLASGMETGVNDGYAKLDACSPRRSCS